MPIQCKIALHKKIRYPFISSSDQKMGLRRTTQDINNEQQQYDKEA